MSKVLSVHEVASLCESFSLQHKKVGLITGCFDVLHIGHIHLLCEAKKQVEILIVGVDNDYNVRTSKGIDRPIFDLTTRMEVLSHVRTVDYLFPILTEFTFSSDEAEKYYDWLLDYMKVSYVISNSFTDSFSQQRESRVVSKNIRYIDLHLSRISSSSLIINKIREL